MPIHDWTRVQAGIFHDFHLLWSVEISHSLNGGILPSNLYAMVEPAIPLEAADQELQFIGEGAPKGIGVSVCEIVREPQLYAVWRRRVVVRNEMSDTPVALLEILAPGNKSRPNDVDEFVAGVTGALDGGLHLQLIDLFPPGPFDPNGMHGALWSRLGGYYEQPAEKPLALAAYAAAGAVTCYVEPTSVGTKLIDMPLFLSSERYVNVPLEKTYLAAYEGLPQRWKRVIEAGS